MSVRTIRTQSEEETIQLGRELAATLPRPGLILLTGNLGAGKTTLTKGIAEGVGATTRDEVSSPTFTLIHEYGSGVFHVDLYRLETPREVLNLGLEELLDRENSLVLIEWGERFRSVLPPPQAEIEIETDGEARVIRLSDHTISSRPR
ncbi:MAG TPA: tRNA (adenosine(37)-N6)-threonylcarbamoyltransferase complex ATPase subunit type 1 TsaE [Bryobacteraceae bacterium]|nr:tRNA (adenosine(37)-N6)-threonylcarbamoyltransferase complex ATPase subunit type 1 TsaE [Bryobacteraceae bacterium]